MVHELLTIIMVHDKLKSVLSSSQYNHYGYQLTNRIDDSSPWQVTLNDESVQSVMCFQELVVYLKRPSVLNALPEAHATLGRCR